MTCKLCHAAQLEPITSGESDSACKCCIARELARSPMAFRALAGDRGELQTAIVAVWKESGYAEGRALVWDWLERIKKARASG